MTNKFNKLAAKLTAAATIASMFATVAPVRAAALSEMSNTLEREKIAVDSNHLVEFISTSGVANGGVITLTYEAGFDLTGVTAADADVSATTEGEFTLAANCAGAEEASFAISGQVVTITLCAGDGADVIAADVVSVEIGTNATEGGAGVNKINNPGSADQYSLAIAAGADSGSTYMPIITEDQITVTASIDPTITFDVGADAVACDDTWSSTNYALPLGTLSLGSVTGSADIGDDDGKDHICTKVSHNATYGAVVTVDSGNGASGLASLSVPTDDIDSATGTMAAGTENYGMCASTNVGEETGDTPANGSFSNTDCDADTTPNVTGFTGAVQTAWTVDATVNAFAQFNVAAAIAVDTFPHTDYQDILTWVATATF